MLKISLIVPTFNSAKTLERTLDSFRRQQWPNLEVIIVDGVSGDSTIDQVQANCDLVTKFVSEPDTGIYDAINKGLNLATGDLTAIIGSDDILLDGAIREIAETWSTTRTDIIAGQAILSTSDGNETIRLDESYGAGALLSGIPFCHNAMFATSRTYERVGRYDLRYRICADAHWVHRAIRLGCTCSKIELPVVKFSLHGTSSNDATRIMQETFEVIANNFTDLPLADAESIFRAVRGWSSGSEVGEILARHKHNSELLYAAAVAFLQRSQRLAQSANQKIPNPTRSHGSRMLRKLFASVLSNSRTQ